MQVRFRPEVDLQRAHGAAPRVLAVAPLSTWCLTAVVAAFAIAVGAGSSVERYTRKVRADGVLVADAAGRLHAELFVGSTRLALLHRGQRLVLRSRQNAAGLPSAAWGSIVDVPPASMTSAEAAGISAALARRVAHEPVYRVVAALDAGSTCASLRSTTIPVDASVSIDRRRLIEWVFASQGHGERPAFLRPGDSFFPA